MTIDITLELILVHFLALSDGESGFYGVMCLGLPGGGSENCLRNELRQINESFRESIW